MLLLLILSHLKPRLVLLHRTYISSFKSFPPRAGGASSPKRARWAMKRGEDGVAVKVSRRSKAQRNFGNRKRELLCPERQRMQSALRATISQYDAHRSAKAQTDAQRCKAPSFVVAASAQTALIVFLTEKLNAPLCFLLPKKSIGLFGGPHFATPGHYPQATRRSPLTL